MLATLLLPQMPSSLDAILNDPLLEGAIVCATVYDSQGRTLYERNGGLRVMPASNQKLLTAAFALHTLGPDYRPHTNLWKQRERIVVDSPGDPLMSRDALLQAAKALRLDRRRPVYLRQAYAPLIPDSWEVDDLPNKYAAPITAFTVDRGSFELWADRGRPKLLPEPYGVKILRDRTSGPRRITYDPFARKILVSGELPPARTRLDTLALPRPDEAAASLLGRGVFPLASAPTSPPDLVLTGSRTADMLTACLPPSDNNVAEHLLLMAAGRLAPLNERPYVSARSRMEDFLVKVVGLRGTDLRVFDGSGMSRHNQVTTRSLAGLLHWAAQQPTSMIWRTALARPGTGTLARRLEGVEFAGKTGTLDLVVGLSGYVRTKNGEERTMSLVFNHFACSSTEARNLADKFARSVAMLGD